MDHQKNAALLSIIIDILTLTMKELSAPKQWEPVRLRYTISILAKFLWLHAYYKILQDGTAWYVRWSRLQKKWGTLEFNVRISYITLFLKSCAFVGKSWAKVCSILCYNANFFLLLEEEKTDSTGLQIGTFFLKNESN